MATSEKHHEFHNESRSGSIDEEDSRYECSICYKEAVNPVVLSCGHFYCWECIDEWLTNYAYSKKQCPICKRRVQDGDIIPIYGKGMVSNCKNPRPTAPAPSREEDDKAQSNSRSEVIDWIDLLKVGTVVVGLIGAFMLGRQTSKRTNKN